MTEFSTRQAPERLRIEQQPPAATSQQLSAPLLWKACRAAVLLLPLGGVPVPGAPLNIVIVIFAVPTILTILRAARGGRPVADARATGLLLLFGAALIASAFGSEDLARAMELLLVTFVGLGFAISLTFCVGTIDQVRTLSGDVVLMLTVCAVWALATMPPPTTRFGGAAIDGRATGPFSQPNELGIVCAAGLPIAFVLLSHAKRPRGRLLAGIEMLVLSAGLVLSFSRGAWIAAIAACTLVIIVLPAVRRTLAILVLAGIGALGYLALLSLNLDLTTGLVLDRVASIGDVSNNPGDHRLAIWGESLRQFRAHPLLGTGPEGFPLHAVNGAGPVAGIRPPHPHNIYLSYLNEIGLLGVIPLTLFMGYVLSNVVRITKMARWRPSNAAAASAAAAVFMPLIGVLAMLAHGLLDNPLANPMVAYTWWTLLGLAGLSVPLLRTRTNDLRELR